MDAKVVVWQKKLAELEILTLGEKIAAKMAYTLVGTLASYWR